MKNGLRTAQLICLCPFKVIRKFRPMWLKSGIQNSFNALNSLSRSRKLIVGILVLLALVYYLGPSIFGLGQGQKNYAVTGCIDEKVQAFYTASLNYDAIINHNPPLPDETVYPAYTGNGYIAAAFGTENGLFVRLNRALSLPVKFYPVVGINVEHKDIKDAFVLDLKSGIAHRMQALKQSWHCVQMESELFAHRSRPSVLVQDIHISNPTVDSVIIEFDQVGASGWTGAETKTYSVKDYQQQTLTYRVTTGVIKIPNADAVVGAVIATIASPTSVVVKANSNYKQHIVTIVKYTKPLNKESVQSTVQDLVEKVKSDLTEVMNINARMLKREHTKVWGKLWETGFSISKSKASDAHNGDKINTTIYYVLCNVPAPLHDLTTSKQQRNEILKVLYYPDKCYSEHSTLKADTLWMDVVDEDHIARVVTTWMITLEKHSCSFMVQAGAEGVLQAMVMSFGALKFKDHHLELAVHPKELHRDISFRRINYGNNTHVNISVIVGEDNKANIYVALDRNDKPYYGCDAGCVDAPVSLSKNWQRFPVKLTDPLTSILYITADKQHMTDLKHIIHVTTIEEAPAHEHHVIALHKHGHHFGGLPTLFWVSIAFLILIFHLFLFKLIYNEYCQGQERYARSKYSL
ncbi:hypothetical protein SNE40_003319 [Patella caerulea]|uniref:Uncharacterized protein n=1 Tax=Patella caerulea TaxID=87958 RepID=A0AAN8Q8H4_PATCE